MIDKSPKKGQDNLSDLPDIRLCVRSGGYTHSLVRKVSQVPQATLSIQTWQPWAPQPTINRPVEDSISYCSARPWQLQKPQTVSYYTHIISVLFWHWKPGHKWEWLTRKKVLLTLKLRCKHVRVLPHNLSDNECTGFTLNIPCYPSIPLCITVLRTNTKRLDCQISLGKMKYIKFLDLPSYAKHCKCLRS